MIYTVELFDLIIYENLLNISMITYEYDCQIEWF